MSSRNPFNVPEGTHFKVIIDDAQARQDFYNTAVYPYYELLTQGPETERALHINDLYMAALLTAIDTLQENFHAYLSRLEDHSMVMETVFADIIYGNPALKQSIKTATAGIATHIYFQLRTFGYLSNIYQYILLSTGPGFLLIGVYPDH